MKFSKLTDRIAELGSDKWALHLEARKLKEHNINCDIINITTIKPLDKEAVLKSINKTKCAVTTEEHQILGGLGGSIAQLTAKNLPVPLEFVGVNDSFGESGKPMDLMKKYKIDRDSIFKAAMQVVKKKG